MAAYQVIPEHHEALLVTSRSQPPQFVTQPVPKVTSGSAIIRVAATGVLSYARDVFTGKRPLPHPLPRVPGSASVGHIVAVGDDATVLKVGDFVFTEIFIRGRDDRNAKALQGMFQGGTESSARLAQGEFRDGSYAQYVKVPLENVHQLPAAPQYSPTQWLSLGHLLVAFGGLTCDGGVDLKAGETVVVAPAAGQFGGAAVEAALAMGGRVIALGRHMDALQRLKQGLSDYGERLRLLEMTGDIQTDTNAIGPVDCYFDISPGAAAKSTHIKSCILALKPLGRVCLMGGIHEDISVPHEKIYRDNITITGKWMYEQNAAERLLQLVEAGLLRLDRSKIHSFSLKQWKEAFECAAENSRWGEKTIFVP